MDLETKEQLKKDFSFSEVVRYGLYIPMCTRSSFDFRLFLFCDQFDRYLSVSWEMVKNTFWDLVTPRIWISPSFCSRLEPVVGR
jgi:hypothetical protein